MAALWARVAYVQSAVIAEVSHHAHEVFFAIALALEWHIGDRAHLRALGFSVSHHHAQGRASEKFVTDHARHGIAGKSEHGNAAAIFRAQHAEGKWLRRLDRHLHPVHLGNFRQHGLHHVVVTHAHATARHEGIHVTGGLGEHPLEFGFIIRNDAEVHHVAARCTNDRVQHRQVALANLSGGECGTVGHQFITGGKQRHSCSAIHLHVLGIDAGKHADRCRIQHRSGTKHGVASLHVTSRFANRRTRLRSRRQAHTVVANFLGVFHHHHSGGARGNWRARHDAHRLADTDRLVGGLASRHRVDHVQFDRGARHILCPHGIAIHRRVVEGWHVFARHHVFGKHQSNCLAVVDRHHVESLHRFPHQSLRVGQRNHRARRYLRWRALSAP